MKQKIRKKIMFKKTIKQAISEDCERKRKVLELDGMKWGEGGKQYIRT